MPKRLRLLDGHGHRLFAQDMDAGLEERLRNLVMRGVGRGHGDKAYSVRPARFAGQHIKINVLRHGPFFRMDLEDFHAGISFGRDDRDNCERC